VLLFPTCKFTIQDTATEEEGAVEGNIPYDAETLRQESIAFLPYNLINRYSVSVSYTNQTIFTRRGGGPS
jgi:hypothetical protein